MDSDIEGEEKEEGETTDGSSSQKGSLGTKRKSPFVPILVVEPVWCETAHLVLSPTR